MNVEIWSDVFCPFCYIGKRKFEQALEHFAHRDEVEVTWRSFELSPGAPVENDGDLYDVLAAKFGVSRADAKTMNGRVVAQAASVGLRYDMDRVQPTNSFDAHRLIHLAERHGLQDAAKERLLAAYFTEGQHVGRTDTLVALATEIGLDAQETAAMLASDDYADAVRDDIAEARALGINGVPFFVLDRKFGVSGAQPSEVFLGALDQAWTASHPLTMLGGQPSADAGDDACVDGACAVPADK